MKIIKCVLPTTLILILCLFVAFSWDESMQSWSEPTQVQSGPAQKESVSKRVYGEPFYLDGQYIDPNECQVYLNDDGSYFINYDNNAPTLEEAFSEEELEAYNQVIDAMIETSETNPNKQR